MKAIYHSGYRGDGFEGISGRPSLYGCAIEDEGALASANSRVTDGSGRTLPGKMGLFLALLIGWFVLSDRKRKK